MSFVIVNFTACDVSYFGEYFLKIMFCFSLVGTFLQGENSVERAPLPEGNKQIFVLSENLTDFLKEDLAWTSYVLLRNTNTMSVVFFLNLIYVDTLSI